jgi:hypothetical protein
MMRPRPRHRRLALAWLAASCLIAVPARADDAACIAASEQSLALRRQGRLHDTLQQLAICADAACPAEVKAECSQRVAAADAAMPTLILAAKDGAGNDLSVVTVWMDGAPLASALDGRPLAIDPGEHSFRFEAPGQPPVEKKLVLREGEKDRRESVVLGLPPPPPVAAPLPVAAPPPAPSQWSSRKTLALVGGGLGVVGVALGAVFGAYASSAQSREKGDCSASACPNRPQARADYDAATKDATGSTVAFAAGGVLLAAGVVLWITAPSDAGAPSNAAARGTAATTRGLRLVPGFAPHEGRVTFEGSF